jgi:hypothetical protein
MYNNEFIAFVEYRGDRPFEIHMTGGEIYDMEYSKACGFAMFQKTGGGPVGVTLSPCSKPDPKNRIKFFLKDGVPFRGYVRCGKGYRTIQLTRPEQWEKMGYQRINELPTDPFAGAVDTEAIYCQTCRDWFPDIDLCEHLVWCDKCGAVVHVWSNGRHSAHWDERKHHYRHALTLSR